ncbi:MAG: glycoside hydrolase family 78 protein [Lentisphaerae bacterium]|nr:glycoside hydrolase family 78 protein [Lentisphaerota bacterium]
MRRTPKPQAGPPQALRCEYLQNPIGLDDAQPRLSWQVSDTRRGAVQTAYQIVVATSIDLLNVEAPDVWDSGKVKSNVTAHIPYEGPRLKSRQRCHWMVRVWDANDVATPWCAPQWWELGLLRQRDWAAQWIGLARGPAESPLIPCPYLRREWDVRGPVTTARLYVTALGVHEITINGKRVSDAAFLPGWTDYRKRIPYHTFDVTALVREGRNAIGAILGTGWYAGNLAWLKQFYGHQPRLLLQLELTRADGSRQRLVSDNAWKTATGPLLQSDMQMGETYDARLEHPGWDLPGFDDSTWRPVETDPLLDVPLDAHAGPPVRALTTLPARSLSEPVPGRYVFDLGQNMVGHVRLQVPAGLPAGTELTLRHAEVLNPDGTLYTTNLRTALSTDRYLTRGDDERWEPRFTFHGFRYVELSGVPKAPGLEAVTGIVQHSDLAFTGTFTCSHPPLNQLQQNIQWGQRGNFFEVPTDCPQRNERLGWMGDAQIFCRTACFNADVASFFTQWMTNVVDAQRPDGNFTDVAPDVLDPATNHPAPGWTDAGMIVPWTVYRCYGDKRLLDRHYEAFKRYIACLVQRSPECIGPDDGYGDWLQVDTFTPLDLIATAYFAHSVDLMARIAGVLERHPDVRRYTSLLRRIRRAFQRRYVTPDGRIVGDTQAAYVLALAFDLLPDAQRADAVRHLVHQINDGRSTVWPYHKRAGHLSTGFLAVDKICAALADGGRLDLAYKLLLNEDYPSWLFPVKNGATTIWERWDGWTPEKGFQDPGMNSFNHYAYGAIGEWLYQTVAGLDLADDGAGYTALRIHPRPPPPGPDGKLPLTQAAATYDAPTGRIHSGWKIDHGQFALDVTIPANVRATVTLPGATRTAVTETGVPLTEADGIIRAWDDADGVQCEVGAGKYRFAWRLTASKG